ncbi:BrnA antitoxin family protein [Pedobacter sp.]|jgi:predicted DNA binding CopG/RHH family protein|uniref:BrnA antitoxin family protein n=1 Tax=Pedobacter sp. TaxID=1411316 RepID=UPI002B79DC07|nr:BrnA antitoxin family protein [Pedobacter sp.]HWW42001.1 BrnA antitoxin family protein [Pedobacter sp.]
MKKPLKKLPKFKNEDEERKFWDTHSSVGYFDMSKVMTGPLFPNLKPTSESISLRIPAHILARVKVRANELDVPYQSLMKQYIAKGVWKK